MIVSEKTAALAHDIRDILAPAQHSAELLDANSTTNQSRHTRRISTAIEKTVQLCQAAMSANKSPVMDAGVTSLSATVAEALQLAIPNSKPSLVVSAYLSGADKAAVDANSLCRMVFNLVRNAANAIGDEQGFIRVTVHSHETGLTIDIYDNGPGIPSSVLDRLFPSMFGETSDSGRIGLGLPTTAQMATSLGGELLLRSTNETGTHFTINIPQQSL